MFLQQQTVISGLENFTKKFDHRMRMLKPMSFQALQKKWQPRTSSLIQIRRKLERLYIVRRSWGACERQDNGNRCVVQGSLGMHDAFVDALDFFQVGVEYLKKLRRDGLSVTCERHAGHAASDLIEAVRIGCQRMRLTVIFNLQPMFKITKEDVTVDQAPVLGVGEQIFIVKPFEREQCSAVANPSFVRTMQSLHALHEKFDVPNTSSGKLYIDLIFA